MKKPDETDGTRANTGGAVKKHGMMRHGKIIQGGEYDGM